jgi:hypothetical protein
MSITEIIPTEISGNCDVEGVESVTDEAGTPHGPDRKRHAYR